jgi:hypothetical protein
MIVTAEDDSNAPYRDTKRIFDRATGPKIKVNAAKTTTPPKSEICNTNRTF